MYLKQIKDFFRKEKRDIQVAVGFAIIFTFAVALIGSRDYSIRTQNNIAESLVRFHVRANTNTIEDQDLKILVKDKVLEKIGKDFSDSISKEETLVYLEKNLPMIKEYAQQEIIEQGYKYPVKVSIIKDFFPTKIYGDIALPPGEYDTLRIDIGEAEGDNWWCVMFPPLCFVDITQEKLTDSSRNQFKSLLAPEEYDLISKYADAEEVPIKVKFKIVEWWQKNMKEPMYAKLGEAKR